MSLVGALTQAILPVLAVAAVGYLLGVLRGPDVGPLNTITIYVLAPALVFHSLTTTTISGSAVAKLAGGVVAFTVVMAALAEVVGRATGEDEPVLGALVLSSAFPNAGNYGIPLSAFAFGAVGRSTAVLYIAVQSIVVYTVGVYFASRGEDVSWRSALRSVFSLPLVYAVLAAGLVRALDVAPPTGSAIMETIRLTGDAAIPVMLLILGIQLAETEYAGAITRVGSANALKLLVAPLAGLGIALAFGFDDLTIARVFVLECAMPVAITPLMLTIQFDDGTAADGVTGPAYLGTAIFTTTLISVPVLTVLIALLQSGVLV